MFWTAINWCRKFSTAVKFCFIYKSLKAKMNSPQEEADNEREIFIVAKISSRVMSDQVYFTHSPIHPHAHTLSQSVPRTYEHRWKQQTQVGVCVRVGVFA